MGFISKLISFLKHAISFLFIWQLGLFYFLLRFLHNIHSYILCKGKKLFTGLAFSPQYSIWYSSRNKRKDTQHSITNLFVLVTNYSASKKLKNPNADLSVLCSNASSVLFHSFVAQRVVLQINTIKYKIKTNNKIKSGFICHRLSTL